MVENLPAVNLRVKPIDKALKTKSMSELFGEGSTIPTLQSLRKYHSSLSYNNSGGDFLMFGKMG